MPHSDKKQNKETNRLRNQWLRRCAVMTCVVETVRRRCLEGEVDLLGGLGHGTNDVRNAGGCARSAPIGMLPKILQQRVTVIDPSVDKVNVGLYDRWTRSRSLILQDSVFDAQGRYFFLQLTDHRVRILPDVARGDF